MKVYTLLLNVFNPEETYAEIVCVCDSREKAVERRKQIIVSDMAVDTGFNFMIDNDTKDLNADLVRLFYGYEENWNNYEELEIVESEVE